MKATIQQSTALKGIYRLTKAKLSKPEHYDLEKQIILKRGEVVACKDITLRQTLADQMQGMIRQLHRICETEVVMIGNLLPTVGRAMIANNLTDATPTNTPLVNKVELGTGTTAPANGDTDLETGTYRNDVASLTNANHVAYMTGFFGATETSGTFREAGLFSDGTATLGTGVLLSRVAINITKSTSETLTLDWELTIN